MSDKTYLCIDLKSFYASAECVERGLDASKTNLVVADMSRTEKTICLAVSPSLKAYGISGRARLFEVVQKVKEINANRKVNAPKRTFIGESYDADELASHPELELSYVVAAPRMALYMEYSTKIYHIYLKYLAPEDIHVYSIDEVMCDVTAYLSTYQMTAKELAAKMIKEVYQQTGITATAGIGSNLYLSKIAMDIEAKHVKPNEDGVCIAELDEMSYRRRLWNHRPLTDFWRIGSGYMRKLHANGMFTMGDIARCSLGKSTDFHNEELLYRLFGVQAELLIDHAWGWEPCTLQEIKEYKPSTNCISSGQVLQCPYEFHKAKLVVREMIDLMALDLVEKKKVTDQLVLTIGYDIENLTDPHRASKYKGPYTIDSYGRKVPKHAQGTVNLEKKTSSTKKLMRAVTELYERIVNKHLLIRRINITANHIVDEETVMEVEQFEQMDLFTDYQSLEKTRNDEKQAIEKEKKLQQAMIELKKKYGKNTILKGMNLEEGATAKERNSQIGGHKA